MRLDFLAAGGLELMMSIVEQGTEKHTRWAMAKVLHLTRDLTADEADHRLEVCTRVLTGLLQSTSDETLDTTEWIFADLRSIAAEPNGKSIVAQAELIQLLLNVLVNPKAVFDQDTIVTAVCFKPLPKTMSRQPRGSWTLVLQVYASVLRPTTPKLHLAAIFGRSSRTHRPQVCPKVSFWCYKMISMRHAWLLPRSGSSRRNRKLPRSLDRSTV